MVKNTALKLVYYETYLKESQYAPYVQRARILLDEGLTDAAEEVLKYLPDERVLLEELVNKLKDKPVYKALKRGLRENSTDVKFVKALFSLGTHILIECEQGNTEYKMLLSTVYHKIGSLLKDI